MTHTSPDTAAPLGVALVGFGFAGRTFHAPFIATTPGLALRVVASSQPDLVRGAYPDADVVASPQEAMVREDVDLVVLATPNDTHAPLAASALRAGRHVVVDKPFTLSLDEARTVVGLARASNRCLSVFQNRRWDSDFCAVQDALRAGLVGEVVEMRSEISRWRPVVRDRWRERAGPGAGLWYDFAPHLLDQAIVLFGVPDTVQATLRTQRPGGQTVDWFHVVLDYPSRQVVLASSMLATDATPRFVVRGTTGSLVKQGGDPQERRLVAGERPVAPDWGHDADPLWLRREGEAAVRVAVPPGDYGQFYAAMRDAIRGDGPTPVTLDEATTVMAAIEAGLVSSLEGRRVPLAPLLRPAGTPGRGHPA